MEVANKKPFQNKKTRTTRNRTMHEHSLIAELEKSFADFNSSISDIQRVYGRISSKIAAYHNPDAISREYLKEMAGNLAHEIRNPLGGIATYVELLGDDAGAHSENIEAILAGVQRIDKIVENLIVFSKPVVLHKIKCNFPDLVEKVVQSLCASRADARPEVTVRFHRPKDELFANIDVQLMQQALMNVLINSVENMSEDGAIDIALSERTQDGRIALCLSDTGNGLVDDDVEKPFYPFYTTKTYGMGLGLPTTRLIIEKHNGHVRMQKNRQQGVMVIIQLPVSTGLIA